MRLLRLVAAFGALLAVAPATPALAAGASELPGESMSLLWGLPFVGLLLSIATGPILYPHFWERHQGKFSALL
jgi:hypothetical protein